MDLEEKNTENPAAVFRHSLSIDRASSGRSSRRSSSYSYVFPRQIDDHDDNESESVSEAGDIGDRALHRNSSSNRFRLSLDHVGEKSTVVPILDDSSFQSKGSIADIRDATVQSLDVKQLSLL